MKVPLRVATVSSVFGIDCSPRIRGTVESVADRATSGKRPRGRPKLIAPDGRGLGVGSAGERLARLEQGLQATEDVHPAAGDALCRLRRALELVVHDGEQAVMPPSCGSISQVTRLVSSAASSGSYKPLPAVDEPARRVGLEDSPRPTRSRRRRASTRGACRPTALCARRRSTARVNSGFVIASQICSELAR